MDRVQWTNAGLQSVLWLFLAGVLFGVMNKKTRMSRSAIVVLGTVILAVCLSAIYVTFPRRASLEKSDDAGIFEPR